MEKYRARIYPEEMFDCESGNNIIISKPDRMVELDKNQGEMDMIFWAALVIFLCVQGTLRTIYPEAKDYIVSAIKLDPSNGNYWLTLGVIESSYGHIYNAIELYKKAITFIVDDENFVNHKHSKFFLNDVHKKQIDYYEKKMKDVVTPYYNILEYINELLKPKYKEVVYQFNQQQNVITNKNDIEMLRQLYITISTVIFMR